MNKGYQGWSNKATWGVNLIIDNDEALYHMRRDAAHDIKAEGGTISDLADLVREAVTDLVDQEADGHHLLIRQLVANALGDVNWHELVEGDWKEA